MSEARALPFITMGKNGFEISQEASEFLASLENKKVGVICVVGKYRTGKSYFINKVLLNRENKNGFNVGPTINPCTKVV
jgi:polynucleotide 5'-kinase involved in rRNA processing